MGSFFSKTFVISNIPGQGPEVIDVANKLHLSRGDLNSIYTQFCALDSDNSGVVDVAEFIIHNDITSDIFGELVFTLFDQNKSGKLDFQEYVTAVWNYCTLPKDGLARFAFDIFDVNNSGTLSVEEIREVIDMIWGFKNNDRVTQALKRLTDNDTGEITGSDFVDMAKHFPILLFPVFEVQDKLRKKCLGNYAWSRLTDQRYADFEKKSVFEILECEVLHADESMDYLVRRLSATGHTDKIKRLSQQMKVKSMGNILKKNKTKQPRKPQVQEVITSMRVRNSARDEGESRVVHSSVRIGNTNNNINTNNPQQSSSIKLDASKIMTPRSVAVMNSTVSKANAGMLTSSTNGTYTTAPTQHYEVKTTARRNSGNATRGDVQLPTSYEVRNTARRNSQDNSNVLRMEYPGYNPQTQLPITTMTDEDTFIANQRQIQTNKILPSVLINTQTGASLTTPRSSALAPMMNKNNISNNNSASPTPRTNINNNNNSNNNQSPTARSNTGTIINNTSQTPKNMNTNTSSTTPTPRSTHNRFNFSFLGSGTEESLLTEANLKLNQLPHHHNNRLLPQVTEEDPSYAESNRHSVKYTPPVVKNNYKTYNNSNNNNNNNNSNTTIEETELDNTARGHHNHHHHHKAKPQPINTVVANNDSISASAISVTSPKSIGSTSTPTTAAAGVVNKNGNIGNGSMAAFNFNGVAGGGGKYKVTPVSF